MLVIVAILLLFGVVVSHKWRNNAAAKKEEILRLVIRASEEEAEIAKIQQIEDYSFHPPVQQMPVSRPGQVQQQEVEKRHYCAVCRCPTTTRCSQCKAVRYCSGKCQIIHWRQGHKDECRPAVSVHASKGSEDIVDTDSENQFEMHSNQAAKICPEPIREDVEFGSSDSSLPCFSSSSERSETSFDSSVGEDLVSGTPIRSDKVTPEVIGSHISETTSDSDDVDVPSPSPLNCTVTETLRANKIKQRLVTTPEKFFQSTSLKDRRNGNGAAVLEEFVLGTTELRSSESFSSLKTSSSVEDQENQAQPSDNIIKSVPLKGPGNHQVPIVEPRSSQCPKSLRTSSDDYWENGLQQCYRKETKPTSLRSLASDRKMSAKTESPHTLPSEIEVVRMLSDPTGKGLKTSVRKFVQHFRTSKQSKSYTYDMEKDSDSNCNHKIIFPPKLFKEMYSRDVELHPFGLVNCGNSCYANAVLQCLMFTRPITTYLLQGFHSKTCRKRDWCLICEVERLIQKGQEMNSPLSPIRILSQIQRIGSHLSHGREEDAHDFLRNVVDTMQSIWLKEAGVSGSLAEDSTVLGLTFGGYLRSKIRCMKCLGRSEQRERMMDLTVEIDGYIDTIEEALAQFTKSETLGGDDKYKCSRCKSYEKAKKKLTVLKAPNILTIILKRFRSGNSEKLNKLVHFPEVLNLGPYMSGANDKYPIYHLYAVVVHLNMMNGAYSGHYISYIKDYRGDWFRIDDSRVSHVDLETVLSVEAYILFYARDPPRDPSLMRNSTSVYSDGKGKRNTTEAVPSSTTAKRRTPKPKPNSFGRVTELTESTILDRRTERHPYMMYPDDSSGSHIVDSSSDSSSIFSVSDAGSYSTDSTKDSSAEEISGYLFGSNWYKP